MHRDEDMHMYSFCQQEDVVMTAHFLQQCRDVIGRNLVLALWLKYLGVDCMKSAS